MLLMMQKIKQDGIKVILSGQGSDQIFGGYLYFKYAPNVEQFQHQLNYKINDLYRYDLLRGNKVAMSQSIELRVPFLDIDFVKYAMNIDT